MSSLRCALLKYGHRIVYDSGSNVGEKLSYVSRDKIWYWPAARSDLVKIQSMLPDASLGDYDQPIWNVLKKNIYTCSETWNAIRVKLRRVNWWRLICIP